MKRNKRLLLKTAKRIEDIPQSYSQRDWFRESKASPCGTAGCLAGEIIICSEPTVSKGIKKLKMAAQRDKVSELAASLVGFDIIERHNLFHTASARSWPDKFWRMFRLKQSTAAVALLRYLADGGEV